MRTTWTIDDDVLAAAKRIADRDRTTVGQVISALARLALARSTGAGQQVRNGIPLLPPRGTGSPITPELVHRLRDETP